MLSRLRLVAAGSLLTLFGCATATVEEVEPGKGGVITVSPKDSADARSKAKALMEDNCGNKKAKIVKEGYAVVGSSTQADSQEQHNKATELFTGKKKDVKTTTTTATTRDVKEWRLTYVCN